MRRVLLLIGALLFFGFATAQVFDHQHSAWDGLLKRHVRWINGGTASSEGILGGRTL